MAAVVDNAPRDLLSALADVLFYISSSFPAIAREGIFHILNNPRIEQALETSEKERVLNIASSLKPLRRYRAFVNDLSAIFRSQMTSDVLLSYEF